MKASNGRVAIIAGATDEVGQSICLRQVAKGDKIAIIDTDQKQIDRLAAQVKEAGGESLGLVVDLSNPEDIAAAVGRVADEFGQVDVLVNNLDRKCSEKIQDISYQEFASLCSENLTGVFALCKEVVQLMQANKGGNIVTVSSIDYLGEPELSGYAASKSALFGFTRALALEVAKDDITINVVAVGDLSLDYEDEKAEQVAAGLPVRRLGTLNDVAQCVDYLASDRSKYVTGQTLFVGGGKQIYYSVSA